MIRLINYFSSYTKYFKMTSVTYIEDIPFFIPITLIDLTNDQQTQQNKEYHDLTFLQ